MDLSKCVCTSDLEVLDLDDPGADTWSEVWKKPCGWENLDRIVVDEDEADALVGQLEGMPYEGSELVMNPALPEFTCIVRKEGRQEETLVAFKKTILPPEGPSYEQGGTKAYSRHAIDAYVHINNGGEPCGRDHINRAVRLLKGRGKSHIDLLPYCMDPVRQSHACGRAGQCGIQQECKAAVHGCAESPV